MINRSWVSSNPVEGWALVSLPSQQVFINTGSSQRYYTTDLSQYGAEQIRGKQVEEKVAGQLRLCFKKDIEVLTLHTKRST